MTLPLFDFGIVHVRRVPDRGVLRMWSWSILLHDCPGRIFHIVRRSGALREWK
jgi:hypothetical protein